MKNAQGHDIHPTGTGGTGWLHRLQRFLHVTTANTSPACPAELPLDLTPMDLQIPALDGLQRQRFLPAIALLEQHLDVLFELGGLHGLLLDLVRRRHHR